MSTTKPGSTDLDLTRIGFGARTIGASGSAHGWGPRDDTQSTAAIRRPLDPGGNRTDGPVYGRGHSEAIVEQALAGCDRSNPPFTPLACGETGPPMERSQKVPGRATRVDSGRG
jgi:aryl-alcohol dehydrogenase-like predicted oxidoreductase